MSAVSVGGMRIRFSRRQSRPLRMEKYHSGFLMRLRMLTLVTSQAAIEEQRDIAKDKKKRKKGRTYRRNESVNCNSGPVVCSFSFSATRYALLKKESYFPTSDLFRTRVISARRGKGGGIPCGIVGDFFLFSDEHRSLLGSSANVEAMRSSIIDCYSNRRLSVALKKQANVPRDKS